MKIKTYLFLPAVAVATFLFGISIFFAGQFFQKIFSAKEQKIEPSAQLKADPVAVENLVYPPKLMLLETPVIEQAENKDNAEQENEYEFDATGDYYLIGSTPKGFEDFENLMIETRDYENVSEENNWLGAPIPPKGRAYLGWEKRLELVRLNIANKQISFETEKKNGISFQFIGKFIDGEKIEMEEYTDYAVLEGKLIKVKNGKKIAERNVKFGQGGC